MYRALLKVLEVPLGGVHAGSSLAWRQQMGNPTALPGILEATAFLPALQPYLQTSEFPLLSLAQALPACLSCGQVSAVRFE